MQGDGGQKMGVGPAWARVTSRVSGEGVANRISMGSENMFCGHPVVVTCCSDATEVSEALCRQPEYLR